MTFRQQDRRLEHRHSVSGVWASIGGATGSVLDLSVSGLKMLPDRRPPHGPGTLQLLFSDGGRAECEAEVVLVTDKFIAVRFLRQTHPFLQRVIAAIKASPIRR